MLWRWPSLKNLEKVLGKVLVNCVIVINPAMLVISGGLGIAIYDLIRPYIKTELSNHLLEPFTRQLKNRAFGPGDFCYRCRLSGHVRLACPFGLFIRSAR